MQEGEKTANYDKVPVIVLMSWYDEVTKQKEVYTMHMTHTASNRSISAPRYPNAADRSLFWNRCADGLLCAASTMGIVVAFFFILTI